MSTSQSLRSREFGNRSKNSVQLEENDVFYSAADNVPPVGKTVLENGPRRVQALSDSSNNLKKSKGLGLGGGGGSINSFGFKKPTPLVSRIKQDSKLVRSNSAPTEGKASNLQLHLVSGDAQSFKTKEQDLNSFYDFYDELYPEPEFLRDISLQDLKEYVITSPIEIGVDETEDFHPWNNNDSIITEEDQVDVDEHGLSDDENYPEIEKLPGGYAAEVLLEEPGWMRMSDMNISYEKDDPSISAPPCLEYDVESDLAFITDYLSSVMSPLGSFDNIPSGEEDSFDEGTTTIR